LKGQSPFKTHTSLSPLKERGIQGDEVDMIDVIISPSGENRIEK